MSTEKRDDSPGRGQPCKLRFWEMSATVHVTSERSSPSLGYGQSFIYGIPTAVFSKHSASKALRGMSQPEEHSLSF